MARAKQFAHMTNFGELLRHLGGIPPERIRMHPLPGTATEKDLLKIVEQKTGLCELIDGVLVEKAMGAREGGIGLRIGHFIETFLELNDLGATFGADSTLRLFPGLVRLPDVSFVSWDKLPDRCYPDEPIPDLVPDLAVEVLSEGNTAEEMSQKRRDYFAAGVSLVWIVDPRKRTVAVYTSPEDVTVFTEGNTLDGGAVLPGFTLPVARVFERVRKPRPRRGRRS